MTQIAADQLTHLKERADRTIIVHKNGDLEAYIRYEPPIDMFEIARTTPTGKIEVEAVEQRSLLGLVGENPVDLKPLTKTYHSIDGERVHLWKLVDDRHDCVLYVNRQEATE